MKKIYILALLIVSLVIGTVASANWFSDLFSKQQNLGASILYPQYGGTGTSTKPTYGKVLIGNTNGNYDVVATSSLGITSTATVASLDDIGDVVITGTDYGKLLMFNGSNWINQATSTLGLTVSETDPVWTAVSGDYLLTADAFTQALASTTFQPIILANTYDVYGQATGTITIHNAAYNHANYDTAYGWGNHSGLYDVLGQATGTITIHNAAYNHSNYDTAFGWGNHASQEYMSTAFATSTYFQLATWFATTTKANLVITKSQVSDFGTYEAPLTFNYPLSRATNAISIVATSSLNLTVGTFLSPNISQWTNDSSYITQAIASTTFQPIIVAGTYDVYGQATGTITIHNSTYNHANYDTAYGWGNWASQGLMSTAFATTSYLQLTAWYATTTDGLDQGSSNLYNQTHSGEVTGATALTIASNIVDEDNLKMSTSPTDNFVLIASSSAAGGMDWVATSSALLNLGTGGGGSMVYPGAGIALSTGSAWDTSITNNSANWNTAYVKMLSTSTAAVNGNIPYFSGVNTFDNIATTTLTATAPLSLDNPVAKVGGSNSILTCAAASASVAGCLASANFISFNNKWDLASSTITFNKGGTGLITLSAGSLLVASTSATTFSGLATSSANTILSIGANGYPAYQTAATLGLMANPMTNAGDIIYGGLAGAPTRIGTSTGGAVLSVSLTTGYPTWIATSTLGLATLTGTETLSNKTLNDTTFGGTLDLSTATVTIKQYPAFSYATSTAWSATTTRFLGAAYNAETWLGARCFTDVGSVNISFYDGTNRMNMAVGTSSTNFVIAQALSTNNTFTAGEKRYVDIGTPASSPTEVSCSVEKIIND